MEAKQLKKLPGCPFFNGKDTEHAGKKVFCESPVPGSTITLYFRKKKDFDMQYNIFCCDHYKNCEVYRAVVESYEEGGSE